MKTTRSLILLTGLLFAFGSSFSQEPLKKRPSPLSVISMKHKNTYLKVVYSQPHKNGREIFGSLVPYGKVWRTGANEATEITLTDTVLIAGDTLNAGTYSIFTIPNKDSWTVIFNNELGQWGAYNYLQSSDELRIEVPTETVNDVVWEPFTMQFEQKNGWAYLQMMWDETKIKLLIEFLD